MNWNEDYPEYSPGMLSHLVDLFICFITIPHLALTKVLSDVCILIPIFHERS